MEQQQQNNAQSAPAPYAEGTGTAQLIPGQAELARLSYRERLALKRSDPEAYAHMREQ